MRGQGKRSSQSGGYEKAHYSMMHKSRPCEIVMSRFPATRNLGYGRKRTSPEVQPPLVRLRLVDLGQGSSPPSSNRLVPSSAGGMMWRRKSSPSRFAAEKRASFRFPHPVSLSSLPLLWTTASLFAVAFASRALILGDYFRYRLALSAAVSITPRPCVSSLYL